MKSMQLAIFFASPDLSISRQLTQMAYRSHITIESGKRGGKPCLRGLRITVEDILGWIAAGMTNEEILDDFPELMLEDIHAALAYPTDRN